MPNQNSVEYKLFDFAANPGEWLNIDDVVMGGISQSGLEIDKGIGIFRGLVSLENHRGFASSQRNDLVAEPHSVVPCKISCSMNGLWLPSMTASVVVTSVEKKTVIEHEISVRKYKHTV